MKRVERLIRVYNTRWKSLQSIGAIHSHSVDLIAQRITLMRTRIQHLVLDWLFKCVD